MTLPPSFCDGGARLVHDHPEYECWILREIAAVLAALEKLGGAAKSVEVAGALPGESTRGKSQAVGQVLRAAVRRGFCSATSDRRSMWLLTESGRELLRQQEPEAGN